MSPRRNPAGREAALADVQDWSKQIHSTAFMVIHRGAVVAEWGDTAKAHRACVGAQEPAQRPDRNCGRARPDKSKTIRWNNLGIDDNEPPLTGRREAGNRAHAAGGPFGCLSPHR